MSDLQLMDFQPQVEEISGLYQVQLKDFLDLFSGAMDEISVRGYQLDGNGQKNEEERFVHREDFVVREESYYVDLLSQIEAPVED